MVSGSAGGTCPAVLATVLDHRVDVRDGYVGAKGAGGGEQEAAPVCGAGVLDYPAIIAELKAMDYAGFLAFEYEGPDDPVEMTRRGMVYLAGLMESV